MSYSHHLNLECPMCGASCRVEVSTSWPPPKKYMVTCSRCGAEYEFATGEVDEAKGD